MIRAEEESEDISTKYPSGLTHPSNIEYFVGRYANPQHALFENWPVFGHSFEFLRVAKGTYGSLTSAFSALQL